MSLSSLNRRSHSGQMLRRVAALAKATRATNNIKPGTSTATSRHHNITMSRPQGNREGVQRQPMSSFQKRRSSPGTDFSAIGDNPAKWIDITGESKRVAKSMPRRGTEFRDGRQQRPECPRRPPFGLDFGIDFRNAGGLDFRASRLRPETYPLRDRL